MSGIVSKNAGRASGIVGAGTIGADAVDGSNIADDAIDSEHYVDVSIDAAHIASNAVTSAKINADAVTGAKIADDAIDSEHYVDGSIDNAHIADDAIDSEHYAAGSIDTAHIADNQITLAKMTGGTDGQIITYDASGDPVAVGPGTDGQVLTSTGSGSPPAFEDAGGGGAWNYISTVVISDDAEAQFTSNINSTYSVYAFMLKNVMLASGTSYDLHATLYAGSWLTSNYSSYTFGYDTDGYLRSTGSTSDSKFWLAYNQYTESQTRKGGVSGYVYLIDPSAGTSVWHTMSWNLMGHISTGTGYPCSATGGGVIVTDTAAVTGVSFKSSSGNLITGEIRMYGIADS